ncbi:hypothetical protein BC941DRAFT_34512 [Chlamydoabsidia padenii]|nr:hypothetical protein BC941DRAFT_34512 [Chlamydoabsidia padenii]
MMSSLLDMEIKGDDDRMTTDTFGRLWLSYPHEQKLQWEAAPTLFNDDIIRWVQEQWEFDVVETIQQECLAMKKLHQHQLVLIHMKIDLPYINITLRSQNASTLYQFSQLFHL